jgi:hypothetical protein
MHSALSKNASRILEKLVEGVDAGASRKIDNSNGYMPVHVEYVGPNMFSVAHYGALNGDLMADPEMVFWKSPLGIWLPVSITQHYVGRYAEAVVFDGEGAKPTKFQPELLAELAQFASMWMKNIATQQGL